MRKPSATAPAKTSPQGRSIDFHCTKLMLTKLAFWTEIRAITAIQTAAMVETIKFVMACIHVGVASRNENREFN
jgi:hypothetical protein